MVTIPLVRGHSLLKHIWVATIGVLGDTVSRVPKTTSSKYLIQRLCDSLKLLKVFFHAGGEGLSDKDLEPKQYKVSGCIHFPSCRHADNSTQMYLTSRDLPVSF